jgi:outer membrane protein
MQSPVLSVSKRLTFEMRTATVSVLAIGFYLPLTAMAEAPKNEGAQWGLGGAAITKQNAYKDIDRSSAAIPLIYFENEYVQLFGPTIDLKLPSYNINETQKLDFSLVGKYDFSGYDDDDIKDTPILNGMHERKGGIWAGAKVEWHSEIVDVSAEWLTDLSGHSKGTRLSLGLERTWMFGEHMMLTPRVTAIWQDKKTIDYYYGVRDDEVRTGRTAYNGNSGTNVEFGTRGTYMFNQHNSIFLDVKVTSLANEIKDSPLIDSSTENSVLFGYLYRF